MGERRGPGPLLPALLLAGLLLGAVAHGPRDAAFLRRHQDNPRSAAGPDYCGAMLRRRGLAPPCPALHTFVHASRAQLRAVCREGSAPSPGLRRSARPLALTTCELRRRQGARCIYRSHAAARYVVLACEHSLWPARYHEPA